MLNHKKSIRINDIILKNECEKELNKKNSQDTIIINLNKEKSLIEKKLNESKLYFKNLYQDKLKGIISEDDFIMLREEYSKDVESNQTRLEEINNELEITNERKENTKDIKSILKKYKNIKTLNKVIVDEFVEKIYIGKLNKETNTREIKIIWNLDL